MKNFIIAILFTFTLAGVSLAQTVSKAELDPARADKSTKPRIAVLEFKAEPNASAIGADGTQTLQNGIASAMAKLGNLNVVDVRKTNAAVQNEYLTLNGYGNGIANAVKIGKLLGVNYVMTGTVTDYNHKLGGGSFAVKVQIIDVATGKVKRSGEANHSVTKIGPGTLDMTEKVIKPLIQKIPASIKAADL
jgi:TolB-like protein